MAATALLVGGGCGKRASAPEQSSADEVRAQRFVLVDTDGLERAELAARDDGSVGLLVRGEGRRTAVWVGINGMGDPSVSILDSQGAPYADLVMYNAEPRLVLCSPPGKPRAGILVSRSGGPRIDLLDQHGKPRLSVDLESLTLFRPDGSALWQAP